MSGWLSQVMALSILAVVSGFAETGTKGVDPIGVGNLKRYVANIDRSVVIYRDILGLELNAPPSKFAVNPQGQKATNTPGAQYRTAFFKLPGVPYTLELVEYTDIERKPQPERKQSDMGDQAMILTVRDLDGTLAKVKKAGLKIVTVGGEAITGTNANNNSTSRAITFHDSDGFQTETLQPTPMPESDVPASANVVRVGVDLTVENLDKAVAFYRDVLGIEMSKPSDFQRNELTMKIIGIESPTAKPSFRTSSMSIGGKLVGLNLIEFKDSDRRNKPSFHPKDPGSSGFSLGVRDVMAAGKVLKAAGADIISVRGEPIPNPRGGGLMYIRDLDGTIIEVSQRATQ